MNRINLFRNTEVRSNRARRESVAWGRFNFDKTTSTLVFAATLIVCSIAAGCSSEKPQPASSNNQPAMTQPVPPVTTPATPAPPMTQASAKPVRKKTARRAPATVTYADKASGVSFQYPRRYGLKTGEAADELLSSDAVAMNFAQPGGVAIAAVAVPESAYPKSDLGAAFFDVSVNKALTEEQCGEFPGTKPAVAADSTTSADPASAVKPAKLMIGEMELQSSESLASQGTREEASKFYHVFENGACYEFALKVATTGVETEGGKPVDREEIFEKLEKILATVKIGRVPEVTEKTAPDATPSTMPAAPAQ